ncbi:alpha/beta fold hydrolase [Schumannella soli]|uniref:Alpha/beta hydrolase n=1 Tax=Schumannella soli TaxID=2590779 RepID=A0A506XWW3_9MICO|nr:alpha/beta fold hydrolase [Schumannella soli]TPW77394.1 alpha/beta hydrolase [Schumannella soli]
MSASDRPAATRHPVVTERTRAGATTLAFDRIHVDEPEGGPVLLLHGFPHTRAVWHDVSHQLAELGQSSIAVDLPGLGDSDPLPDPPTADAVAVELIALLDRLGLERVHVVGLDLGVAAAFALAARHPGRVHTVTLTEGAIGGVPGAEPLLGTAERPGGPWWFGFHQAPGRLAERIVVGSQEEYVRFFLGIGARRLSPDLATRIVAAYRDPARLSTAFDYYRAMPADAAANATWMREHRLAVPALALGGGTVGGLTAVQLYGVAGRAEAVSVVQLDDSGHITPVDQPAAVARAIAAHAAHGQVRSAS